MPEGSEPGSPDRAALLRALEAARSVAFRQMVAGLRKDLEGIVGCRLTAADARGGRVEIEALDARGEQAFADLGATLPDSRRAWFALVGVAGLVAKRKAKQAPSAPPPATPEG